MKKLKLQALKFGATELLSRDQLKNVLGGDGSGSGTCISIACTLYAGSATLTGYCGYWTYGGTSGSPCLCITTYGPYNSTIAHSNCGI